MHTRFVALSVMALVILTAPGCIGGGGDQDAATAEAKPPRSFLSFGGRSKKTAGAGANLDDLSPEASMSRDLDLLRGEEQAGLRRLEELRREGGDPDLARREEERLRDIRSRMARYSALLNRSQMGPPNPYPTREYASVAPVTPARVMERDPVRVPPQTNAPAYAAGPAAGPVYPNLPTDYRRDGVADRAVMPASYSPPRVQDSAQPYAPQYGPGASRGGVSVPLNEGERLIYAPQPGETAPPAYASYTPEPTVQDALPQQRISIAQLGAKPPAAGAAAEPDPAPGEVKFGGATVGRANYPRRPPPAKTREEPSRNSTADGKWNAPDNLYAGRQAAQPVSSYPGLEQRGEERVEWPTHTPAAANRPAPRQAAVALAPTPPPSVVPVSASGNMNYTQADANADEIFVPDLYLSGR